MNDTILFVDDEVRILSALQRSLYRGYRIEIAGSARDALEAMSEGDYAVVVSDMKMPAMDGIEFLTRVKETSPETVRVLLTGYADVETAIAAVNEGSIFRFLTKPCPQEVLTKTLDAALGQHRLITAERDVLRETLVGTVAVLVKILGVIQPMAFGRASRVRGYVRQLAQQLHVKDVWQLEAAAMLSQIGCIATESEVLKQYYRGEQLSPDKLADVLSHARVGAKMLSGVRRLQAVARMIERQHDSFGTVSDMSPATEAVAFGAQMLRVSLDFDRLTQAGRSPQEALAEMRQSASAYNPEVLSALERIDLAEADDKTGMLDDSLTDDPEVQLFHPIADEVLRAIRDLAPTE
jgi:response regulator RpfG family c-di-GMP phosphodiesterase